jgi:hypothetical protein
MVSLVLSLSVDQSSQQLDKLLQLCVVCFFGLKECSFLLLRFSVQFVIWSCVSCSRQVGKPASTGKR